jgi:hypothetical protein
MTALRRRLRVAVIRTAANAPDILARLAWVAYLGVSAWLLWRLRP